MRICCSSFDCLQVRTVKRECLNSSVAAVTLWILRASDYPLVVPHALNFLLDYPVTQEPDERTCVHSAADRRATI